MKALVVDDSMTIRRIVIKALGVAGIAEATEPEKSRVIEAIKTGANDYLIKPFSPDQLAEKVRSLMGSPA